MKRNIGFDIARVFAMFYIIGIDHLFGYTEYVVTQEPVFVSIICSSLGIFTFLSAFLLGSNYKLQTKSEIKNFYQKRIVRFYPLYLISSLLLVAIGFNTWPETLKGLLGISPFWMPQQYTLWYISMLIVLYLLTPLLVRGNLIYKGIVSTSLIVLFLTINYLGGRVDSRLYDYFIVYAVGIILAVHFKDYTLKCLNSRRTTYLLGCKKFGSNIC